MPAGVLQHKLAAPHFSQSHLSQRPSKYSAPCLFASQVIEDLLERYQSLLVRAEEEADGACGR